MSVERIKRELAELSPAEWDQVTNYVAHLRRVADPEYRKLLADRLDDKDPTHWLTLEEFERRLGPDLDPE